MILYTLFIYIFKLLRQSSRIPKPRNVTRVVHNWYFDKLNISAFNFVLGLPNILIIIMQIILCDRKSKLKNIFKFKFLNLNFRVILVTGTQFALRRCIAHQNRVIITNIEFSMLRQITKALFKIAFDAIYRCSTSIHFL